MTGSSPGKKRWEPQNTRGDRTNAVESLPGGTQSQLHNPVKKKISSLDHAGTQLQNNSQPPDDSKPLGDSRPRSRNQGQSRRFEESMPVEDSVAVGGGQTGTQPMTWVVRLLQTTKLPVGYKKMVRGRVQKTAGRQQ